MTTLNPFTNRFRALRSHLGDAPILLIDTEANPQDILEVALQRIRAASDLLDTLHRPSFSHADVKDIPHLIGALRLLTMDGRDLLQVAQQRLLDWQAPT